VIEGRVTIYIFGIHGRCGVCPLLFIWNVLLFFKFHFFLYYNEWSICCLHPTSIIYFFFYECRCSQLLYFHHSMNFMNVPFALMSFPSQRSSLFMFSFFFFITFPKSYISTSHDYKIDFDLCCFIIFLFHFQNHQINNEIIFLMQCRYNLGYQNQTECVV